MYGKEIYNKKKLLNEIYEKVRRINISEKIYFQNIILDFEHILTSDDLNIHFKNCEFK